MNVICWNARGLGSSRAFHELRRLVSGYSPCLLLICERKVNACKANWWRSSLHFDGQFVVDSKGASGGLILFWKHPCSASISSFSQGHIDCVVEYNDVVWRFIGFYGNPKVQNRKHSWSLMKKLACSGIMDAPWLMGGDFNEVTKSDDCCYWCRRPWAQMSEFNNAIQFCGFKSVPCDSNFTWYNQRKEVDARFLKLDRFLCNRLMEDKFTLSTVRALDPHCSDHNPLLLSFSVRADNLVPGKGFKRFFFEQKWLLDKHFAADLLTEWGMHGGQALHDRLKGCQRFLESWATHNFDKISKKLKALKDKRAALLKYKVSSKNFHADLTKLTKEIEKLMEADELHWK
ncbi:uncharacterized protein LOC131025841 [Salvia miltiorrhiza]|uniref:uncharacterized protein LOC131025841 n=1 Tax=Salvia miltiorrhiza TaxID=226208 RepID=UPI0025ABE50D|nr:uncharacterized protein LOC131025841 [Salvia miltiorrhiza]